MDNDGKKKLMIVISVVCLGVAGAVALSSLRGGSGSIESMEDGVMYWMKCRACDSTYQIDRKEYYGFMNKHPMAMTTPPMPCQECGKEAAYRAYKCPECDNIFFEHAAGQDDFGDRCPKCGHSERESKRKAR